jgi:alanine-synthesizing transaminase
MEVFMTGQPFPTLASERMKRLPDYLFARINAERGRLRRENIDVIDLGMGNPNDPTPEPIVAKLQEASGVKRNQRYSVSIGIENLRKEAAKFYHRHFGVQLDPTSEIVASIGSKEAFSHLCLAIMGPGDIAMVGAPTFPIHIYGPVIAGAQVVSIPMHGVAGFGDGKAFLAGIDQMCLHLCPKPKADPEFPAQSHGAHRWPGFFSRGGQARP